MQEDNINFEEIGKDETAHADQSSPMFKQPIRWTFVVASNDWQP